MEVLSPKPRSLIYMAGKSQLQVAKQIPNIRIPAGQNATWKCYGRAQPARSARYLPSLVPSQRKLLGLAIQGMAMESIYWISKDFRCETGFNPWTRVLRAC